MTSTEETDRVTKRTRRGIAGSVLVVVALVFGAVIVSALRAEGRERTEARTNDGGAWLLKRDRGYVGHVNHAVKELTAAVNVAAAGADFDVDQADGIIVVQDRTAGTAVVVEDASQLKGTTVQVGADLVVDAVDGGVLVVNESSLAVYQMSRTEFAGLEENGGLESVTPVLTGEGSGRAASFTDGHAVVVDQAAGRVAFLDPDGSARLSPAIDLDDAIVSITAVGTDTAVLSDSDGDIYVATPGDIRRLDAALTDDAGPLVLQQPSPTSGRVVAAALDGRLFSIPLDGGDGDGAVDLQPLPAGGPVAPIVFGGCVFAVATATPTFLQQCGDEYRDEQPLEGAGQELRLREVNGWIWINDVDSGASWVTEPQRRLDQIEDWGAILSSVSDDTNDDDNEPDEGDEIETVIDPDDPTAEIVQSDEFDEDEENVPPVANDDIASTRVERPVEVDVLGNDTDLNRDPLLITSVTQTGGNAVVSMASDGSAVQVAPAAAFTGVVTFDYSITDGRSDAVSASATVNVLPADETTNQPPEPVADIASTRRGRPTTFDVLTNDDDPEGDALVLESVQLSDDTAEGNHTIVTNPSGQVVFTPDPNTRTDRIELTYTVSDDYGATAESVVVVSVRLEDSNNEPDARNDAARTVVDKPVRIDVLHNDTDPDRDPLFVNAQPILQAPAELTTDALDVSLTADGEFYFNPDAAGTYVFEYSISDGDEADAARIRVDVDEPVENRPPVAIRDDIVVPAGGSRLVYVLDNDGDPDGDIVSLVGNTTATGLTIKEIDGTGYLVTVAPDAPARTEFQYTVTDGLWPDPVAATVVVAVTGADAIDQPPIANDDVAEVRAGSRVPVSVLENDSDPENGVLRVTNVTSTEGVAAEPGLNGQSVSIDVAPTVVSSVTLSYTVADEAGNQANAFIQVRIIPPDDVNRPPVARADIARTQSGTPITIDVRANDKDPDADLFVLEAVSAQPSGGQAEIVDGTVRYTPSPTFSGTDRLAYSIVDSHGAVAIGDVLIGVVPRPGQNRAPEAFDDQISVIAGSAPMIVDALANDSDPDRDPLAVTTVGTPSTGATRVDDGAALVFTPPDATAVTPDAPLELTVPYSIADGRGGTASATVSITVTAAGTPVPPEAVDDLRGPLTPGEVIEVDLLANDVDPDGNPAELVVTSDDPALTERADGVVTYTAGETSGRHRYTVTDADGLTATAELAVLVVDNRAPEVSPITLEMNGDEVRTIDIAAEAGVVDPDDDAVFYACCDGTIGGTTTLEATGGDGLVVQFDPDDTFSGPASFSYTVDDQRGHVVSGSVAIEVIAPANRPPVASPGTFEVEAGTPTPIDLLALVEDPDGPEGLRFDLGAPDNDAVRLASTATTVTATTGIDQTGVTTVVPYTVTDPAGATAESTLTISVTLPDEPPPTAVADTATTNQEEPVTVDVLSNDVDPLGQGLTITNAASPDGSATIAGANVTFTPNVGFFGTATVTYTIRDATNRPEREATGQLTVQVVGRPGAPGAPVAVPGNATAVVSWNPPAINSADIIEYAIRTNDAGDGRSVGAVTSYTYTGLQNGAAVTFSVRARNSAGWGDWSPPSASVTPDIEPARPAAPRVTFGDRQLTVSWSPPPPNGGSPVLSYELRIGGNLNRVVSGIGATTYTWTGLTNGAEYTFQVAATNAKGTGEWSSQSAPEHPLTTPDAPGQPSGQRGDQFIDVTWSPQGNGGDRITSYEVQRVGGESVQVTGQSYRWSNLPNGQAQSFRVRAYNRGGWGAWSAASAAVVPCGAPRPPAAVTAERGDGQATVSWGAGDPNGCAITNYLVTSSGGQSVNSGTATSAVVGGLANGTSYTFRVTATNEAATGGASGPSNAVIPAGPPGPTNVTRVTPGVRQVTVEWDSPNPNGDPIRTYEMQINSGPWEPVGLTNSRVVSGLQSGTNYTFRVRAVNGVTAGAAGNAGSTTTWGEPNQVGGLSVSGGDRRVAASWSTPNGNGAGVDRYEVDLSPGSVVDVQGTSRTFTGLDQDTSYSVRVRACNAVGCGQWSATRSARTDAPPSSIRVSRGSSVTKPDCTHSSCAYVAGTLSNMAPNTSYQIDCFGGGRQFDTGNFTISTNASGNWSGNFSCYWGFPGEPVYFTANGQRSNTITW